MSEEHRNLPSIRALQEGVILSEDEEDDMFVDGMTLVAGFLVSTFRRTAQRKKQERARLERERAAWDQWDDDGRPWPPPGISAKAPQPPGWEDRKWEWLKPYRLAL